MSELYVNPTSALFSSPESTSVKKYIQQKLPRITMTIEDMVSVILDLDLH